MEDWFKSTAWSAAAWHAGQKRKWGGGPYARHPIRVAKRALGMGAPQEAVEAALLHDVVEDCDATIGEIRSTFGPAVAEIVDGLTDKFVPVPGGPNRKIRKEREARRLGGSSASVRGIKALDLEDNLSTIPADDSFAALFREEAAHLILELERGTKAADAWWTRAALCAARNALRKLETGFIGDSNPTFMAYFLSAKEKE